MSARLTAHAQLWPTRSLPRFVTRRAPRMAPLARGVVDPGTSCRLDLWRLLSPPFAPFERSQGQARLYCSPRQRMQPSRAKTPSIDRCSSFPKERFSPTWEREPATGLVALPPAIRLPTLFRLPTLSRGKARLRVRFTNSSLVRDRSRTPPVDFCNRCGLRAQSRTFRTPQDLAGSRPPAQLFLSRRNIARCRLELRMAALLAKHSQPRVHGSEAASCAFGDRSWLLPRRSLAVETSPQPDRLGHLMSPARHVRRLECRRRERVHVGRAFSRACLARSRFRGPPPLETRRSGLEIRVASRALPRRRACSAAPEVPSVIGTPSRAAGSLHMLSPAVENCPTGAFCVPHQFESLRR